ncbi:MAG: DUF6775 family putative metallopeptidase [Chloroflexota bacterium]
MRLYLYSDSPSPSLEISYIEENLKQYGLQIENRGSLLDFLSTTPDDIGKLAKELSSILITDIENPLNLTNTSSGSDIESEFSSLMRQEIVPGKFYDGLWMQRILYRLLSDRLGEELADGSIHLIFTGRLFGTFEDRRYHARVVLMGTPSLISTSGLVEAPAKPKEYYYVRGRMIQSGMDTSELDSMYKGRFVEYDDPKISSILVSYALQVISYEKTGEAFCDDPECCLSNSHWQEEVLNIQYEGVLCDKCKVYLELK